jgi:hypothetical protein
MNDKQIIEQLADKPLPKPYDMGDGTLVHPTPCIKSGFCCTKAPCAYGEFNEEKTACKYLTPANELGQRMCGRFEWIKANVPVWENYPAFGAGCCMPMFNEKRKEIIENYKKQ